VIECVAFEMIGDRRKCDELLNGKESAGHEKKRNGKINATFKLGIGVLSCPLRTIYSGRLLFICLLQSLQLLTPLVLLIVHLVSVSTLLLIGLNLAYFLAIFLVKYYNDYSSVITSLYGVPHSDISIMKIISDFIFN